MFKKVKVKLLYSTAYHPQIYGQKEKNNLILDIALYFQMFYDISYGQSNQLGIIPKIQRELNNSWSAIRIKTSNKATFGFISTIELDLLKLLADKINSIKTCVDVANSIVFAQINSKFHYDKKHQLIIVAVRDYALFQLYKGYSILSTPNYKLDPQYVGFFQITKKVGLLVYQLDILKKQQIYLVFSIAQLKPCPPHNLDLFAGLCLYNSDLVYIKEDTDLVKFFEKKRFISKKQVK